jgi:hypothetical protein
LLRRHGTMVLGVCRRMLSHRQDVEDVFQATFLTLARKAASIRRGESLGCWLTVSPLPGPSGPDRRRLRSHEGQVADRSPPDPLSEITVREAQAVLDEELARLPERLQARWYSATWKAETRRGGPSTRLVARRLKRRLVQGRNASVTGSPNGPAPSAAAVGSRSDR